jgi:hypothetical protein
LKAPIGSTCTSTGQFSLRGFAPPVPIAITLSGSSRLRPNPMLHIPHFHDRGWPVTRPCQFLLRSLLEGGWATRIAATTQQGFAARYLRAHGLNAIDHTAPTLDLLDLWSAGDHVAIVDALISGARLDQFTSVLAFDYFFLPPQFHLWIEPSSYLRLAVFIGAALLVEGLIEGKRRVEEDRKRAEEALRTGAQDLGITKLNHSVAL